MPTIQTKRAFNKVTEKIANKEPVVMGEILREVGYAESVALNPSRVTDSKGWKQLMASIDDTMIIEKVLEIATDSKDKRSCLAAADMVFKLKDRYPQRDSKMVGLFKDIS